MNPHAPAARRAGETGPALTARALTVCALASCALTGCGLQSGQVIADSVRPGSVGAGRPLAGAHLTVASKQDTEQRILGQITGLVFKAAGASVRDKTGISGSIGAREAIETGTADAMYDYTGTAWITYLGHTRPIADPQAQWRAVRDEDARNGVAWLPIAQLDNTYAFAVNAANGNRYGLRSLSDVAALSRRDRAAVTLCADNEFAIREDGLPGVLRAYGITLPKSQVMTMDAGLIYTQIAAGRPCVLGDVYATDGRIPADRLTVLRDDRHFFPDYNAAPVVHAATLRRYPQIGGLLAPVTERLTTQEAQKLNAQVDVDGRDVRAVAKQWLADEGFIKE